MDRNDWPVADALTITPPLEARGPNDFFLLTPSTGSLKSLDENEVGEEHFYIADPITAAMVAMWLAEGAVAYVGGLALSKILGHPDLSDIARLIKQAVEELKRFIRAELQRQIAENEIKKMEAQFESVVRNLRHYDLISASSPAEGRYLLHDAVITSGELMSLAKRFDMSGAFVYANSASTRAIAFTALGRIENADGNAQAASETLKEARSFLSPLVAAHDESWQPAGRVVFLRHARSGPQGGPVEPHHPVFNYIDFLKDGVPRRKMVVTDTRTPIAPYIEAFRQELLSEANQEYVAAREATVLPLTATATAWSKMILP